MSYKRKMTREVRVGDVKIGGNNPISVQSMTNTDTRDVEKTVAQIKRLEEVGCDIVRVAVVDMDAAKSISKIKEQVNIPIIADIHFDYRLALEAIEQGVDGIRINPGNIGSIERVKAVVEKCKERDLKIRIGVNGGSLEKELLKKYGSPTAEALVESAMGHIKILEDLDFHNIVISLKSSDIYTAVEAYELMSQKVDYPLHIGITEAGGVRAGTIKSSIGIGSLLLKGIGDTMRISLTGDPVEEVKVGKDILRSLNLLNDKIKIVSCPTCGRCNIDLINIANEVENKIQDLDKNMTVAIMGCVVNGPGEAREADIGIAGGKGQGILFKKGKLQKRKISLCIYGGLSTFFIYGFLLDTATWLIFPYSNMTLEGIIPIYLSGIPFNIVHALATVFFLAVISKPMIEKLDRIKEKYGLIEP